MKSLKNSFAVLLLTLIVAVFSGCIFDSSNPAPINNPDNGSTNKGNFIVSSPGTGNIYHVDSTIAVTWHSFTVDSNSYVSIQLYRSDTLVYTATNYAYNRGSYTLYLPAVPSGTTYHIKVVSTSDTSRYDFGSYFEITNNYFGSFIITSPIAGTYTRLNDSSLTIRWTTTGTVGNYVGIKLYCDTSLATIVTSYSSNTGTYYWSSVQSNKGSGSLYRIKIYSYNDTTIFAYSGYFTIGSQYYGAYTISAPDTSSTWVAGTSYSIQWTTSGSPGSYVMIELYQNSVYKSTITSYSSNYGYYTWSIPSYTISGKYQIKISSYNDNAIYKYSSNFNIQGLTADAYEPDSSRATSKSILIDGIVQPHSLTYKDTDWVSMNLEKGKTYSFRSYGEITTYVYIYRGQETSYSVYFSGNTSSTAYNVWTCDSTSTYYARISPFSGYYGDYAFSVGVFDSTSLFVITNPIASSVFSAGSSYYLQWATDSAFYVSSVSIYLYVDTVQIMSYITSYTSNSGQYYWYVPSGMATGSRYRIKIQDYNNTNMYSFSNYFTISGVATDSFEVDNIKTQATTIGTNGILQSHSMSYADTDWVVFTGKKDSLYVITASGTPYLYTYLYSATSTSYLAYDSYINPQIVWTCTTDGNYYVKIMPYSSSSSSYGSYSLSVRSYSRYQMANFISPTASTVWASPSTNNIQWTPDTTLFSTYVGLYLYRGGKSVYTITSSSYNNGSYQAWTIPAGFATGNNYRICMTNYNNSLITAFSDSFSLAGITPDSAEPNDSASQAFFITASDTAKNRTLTYSNADWNMFRGEQGYVYKIVTKGLLYLGVYLYSTDGATSIMSGTAKYSDSTTTLTWYCPLAGNYYFSISGTNTGAYSLTFSSYTSSQYSFKVTAPAASAVLTRSTNATITWTDSVGVGGYVDIFLYDATSVVGTIASNISNTGTYTWAIPSTAVAKSGYYVHVVSRMNSNIFGNSGTFTIQ